MSAERGDELVQRRAFEQAYSLYPDRVGPLYRTVVQLVECEVCDTLWTQFVGVAPAAFTHRLRPAN